MDQGDGTFRLNLQTDYTVLVSISKYYTESLDCRLCSFGELVHRPELVLLLKEVSGSGSGSGCISKCMEI